MVLLEREISLQENCFCVQASIPPAHELDMMGFDLATLVGRQMYVLWAS